MKATYSLWTCVISREKQKITTDHKEICNYFGVLSGNYSGNNHFCLFLTKFGDKTEGKKNILYVFFVSEKSCKDQSIWGRGAVGQVLSDSHLFPELH